MISLATVLVAVAFARRLIFHGETITATLLGIAIVAILACFALYELFEAQIRSKLYQRHGSRFEHRSVLADRVFLLLGSLTLGIGFLLYEPSTPWLQAGRIFLIVVSSVGTMTMSYGVYVSWRDRRKPRG